MRGISQVLLGGWFTDVPAFLISVAAKQKFKKHAHGLTLAPISPLEAILQQKFIGQENTFFSSYEEFVLISDSFIFSCGACNRSFSIFLDLAFSLFHDPVCFECFFSHSGKSSSKVFVA